MKKILTISLFIISFLFIGSFFVPYKSFTKILIIEKGSSGSEIVNTLVENKVIGSKFLGYSMLYLHKISGKTLKSGEYEFSARESVVSAFRKIRNGKVIIHYITIPEGLTNYEIYQIVNTEKLLSGVIDAKYNEGDFLPETYDYKYGDTKNTILNRMHSARRKLLDKAWESRNKESSAKTPAELLTLASIIEKETGVNDERAKVSSVFNNRLRVNMPLQADPTVIYAITNGKADLGRRLNSKDLKIKSPYNTYVTRGLPPTPICNPGAKSIMAAAKPATTHYYYFVSNNNGSHNFATNLADHIINVNKYKKAMMQKN